MFDDLANLHATLSASGGEGRGEVVINLGSTTSSSALSGTFSSRVYKPVTWVTGVRRHGWRASSYSLASRRSILVTKLRQKNTPYTPSSSVGLKQTDSPDNPRLT